MEKNKTVPEIKYCWGYQLRIYKKLKKQQQQQKYNRQMIGLQFVYISLCMYLHLD